MPVNKIIESFSLAEHRCIYIIGGGGKTSLMYALSRVLANEQKTVVTTTSTKILCPEKTQSECVLSGQFDCVKDELDNRLRTIKHVTIAGAALEAEENKLCGFTLSELDEIAAAYYVDYLLVEADGSAGRSIKAHMEHEPVISAKADLVIVVIGADCLGMPMDARYVHRVELFCRRLNRPLHAIIDADDVAAIVFHVDGYLKKVSKETEVIVFISKVHTSAVRNDARLIADALKTKDRADRIKSILAGEIKGGEIYL